MKSLDCTNLISRKLLGSAWGFPNMYHSLDINASSKDAMPKGDDGWLQ